MAGDGRFTFLPDSVGNGVDTVQNETGIDEQSNRSAVARHRETDVASKSQVQLNAQFISLEPVRTSMSSETDVSIEVESTVNDSYGTTIPAAVREALGEAVEPGDTVRWVVRDGDLSIELVHERYGAFEDVDPFDGPAWDSEAAAENAWSE